MCSNLEKQHIKEYSIIITTVSAGEHYSTDNSKQLQRTHLSDGVQLPEGDVGLDGAAAQLELEAPGKQSTLTVKEWDLGPGARDEARGVVVGAGGPCCLQLCHQT